MPNTAALSVLRLYLGVRTCEITDDVKQRKQKHFKQYRTAKQKLTNKENLVKYSFLFTGFTSSRRHRICKTINTKTQTNEQGKTMPYRTIKNTIQ